MGIPLFSSSYLRSAEKVRWRNSNILPKMVVKHGDVHPMGEYIRKTSATQNKSKAMIPKNPKTTPRPQPNIFAPKHRRIFQKETIVFQVNCSIMELPLPPKNEGFLLDPEIRKSLLLKGK